nr:MAG TPA: hypothetical protein [Caudoviricetes sp.]
MDPCFIFLNSLTKKIGGNKKCINNKKNWFLMF